MLLKNLTLNNVRAFSHAEFTFQPGMNLIVGINGVGKSTVLEVIRIVLATILPKFSLATIERTIKFKADDIKVGESSLTVSLNLQVLDTPIQCEFQYLRKAEVKLNPNNQVILDRLKQRVIPLAVYFSPQRAIASMAKSKDITYGVSTAFVDALKHRELRFLEFADWLFAQENLALENVPHVEKFIDTLNSVISYFLDSLGRPRAFQLVKIRDVKDKPHHKNIDVTTNFRIEKSGVGLTVSQLSDGERGMLALVLDLARRLAIANPDLEDPLQGKAVVLIDELDLHLHPKWQRTIVQKLTTTFPNCQFIATTHSPLIISEVPSSGLILLSQEDDQINVIQSGLYGFGFDTSWILRHLMDTDSRNPEAQTQIDRVEEALEDGDLDLARQHLEQLKTMLHGKDDEVIRLEASINNLEALADAMDTEAE
ncbi:hypothetical protein LEP3755_07130 [Leptolyngbya sp. NIES-3755]|nr:hypothetical protein LEP3755_07130 [Leptolyngbya sp. NIES-3755]